MAEEPFEIEAEVSCSDGACGELSRVVVDPVARTVTHLVVEPEHGHAPGRLVPVELAQTGSDGFRRTAPRSDFDQLDPADETQFLGPASGWPGLQGYGSEQVLSWRYYGLSWGACTR